MLVFTGDYYINMLVYKRITFFNFSHIGYFSIENIV